MRATSSPSRKGAVLKLYCVTFLVGASCTFDVWLNAFSEHEARTKAKLYLANVESYSPECVSVVNRSTVSA